ncbi:hypothetical protein D3C76_1101950 [compost metagenome]
MANAQGTGAFGEFRDKLVMDFINDVEAFGRRADLPAQVERRRHRSRRRHVQRCVPGDDQRIAATGLDHARFHPFGAGHGHRFACRNAAGERHRVGLR